MDGNIQSPLNLLLKSINPKISEKLRNSIEKTAHILQSSQTRNFIEMMLIDPFLKYIFARIFPYIVIGISLFLALFILIIALFVIILMNKKNEVNSMFNSSLSNLRSCPLCYA